jgi:hypothetical protein
MTNQERRAANVLERAQRASSPSAADAGRVQRALVAALAAGTPAPRMPGLRAPRWAARLLAAGTIAAASGTIGYWAGHRAAVRENLRPAQPALSSLPSTPSALPATGPPAEAPASPTLAPPAAAHRGGHSPRREPEGREAATGTSLTIEVRGLRNAERALRDGNPGLALAFLADLDREVPNGRLSEERDAVGTLARCGRGDRPIGVDLAGEFVERHPASVYRARVEQTCAMTDHAGPGDSRGGRFTK